MRTLHARPHRKLCERSAHGVVRAGAVLGEYGGALSDLVEVPYADAMLVPLPAGIDPAAAASVSDNVPDGWRAVAPYLAERPGAPVLVLGGAGGGSVGLYAAAVAVALGSERVDYVDEDPDRLAVAASVGANAMEEPIGKRYGPYPITVNHTTEPKGLATALRSTEAGGTCTSTTVYFGADITIPMLEMYTRGVTLTTSRVSARAGIPSVLELMTSGRLHPELVTASVVDWANAADALDRAHAQDGGRTNRSLSYSQATLASSKRKRRSAARANSAVIAPSTATGAITPPSPRPSRITDRKPRMAQ